MRRAVHGLLAVAMLAGMSLALAGALAAVVLESDTRGIYCELWRADLYRTSNSTAYASVSAGIGPDAPASVSAVFSDDDGDEHELALFSSGGAWEYGGPLNATVSAGREYLIRASVSGDDGSASSCFRAARPPG